MHVPLWLMAAALALVVLLTGGLSQQHLPPSEQQLQSLLAAHEFAAVLASLSPWVKGTPYDIRTAAHSLHFYAGSALLALRRFAEAQEALRLALREKPSDADAWISLGEMNLQMLNVDTSSLAFYNAFYKLRDARALVRLIHVKSLTLQYSDWEKETGMWQRIQTNEISTKAPLTNDFPFTDYLALSNSLMDVNIKGGAYLEETHRSSLTTPSHNSSHNSSHIPQRRLRVGLITCTADNNNTDNDSDKSFSSLLQLDSYSRTDVFHFSLSLPKVNNDDNSPTINGGETLSDDSQPSQQSPHHIHLRLSSGSDAEKAGIAQTLREHALDIAVSLCSASHSEGLSLINKLLSLSSVPLSVSFSPAAASEAVLSSTRKSTQAQEKAITLTLSPFLFSSSFSSTCDSLSVNCEPPRARKSQLKARKERDKVILGTTADSLSLSPATLSLWSNVLRALPHSQLRLLAPLVSLPRSSPQRTIHVKKIDNDNDNDNDSNKNKNSNSNSNSNNDRCRNGGPSTQVRNNNNNSRRHFSNNKYCKLNPETCYAHAELMEREAQKNLLSLLAAEGVTSKRLFTTHTTHTAYTAHNVCCCGTENCVSNNCDEREEVDVCLWPLGHAPRHPTLRCRSQKTCTPFIALSQRRTPHTSTYEDNLLGEVFSVKEYEDRLIRTLRSVPRHTQTHTHAPHREPTDSGAIAHTAHPHNPEHSPADFGKNERRRVEVVWEALWDLSHATTSASLALPKKMHLLRPVFTSPDTQHEKETTQQSDTTAISAQQTFAVNEEENESESESESDDDEEVEKERGSVNSTLPIPRYIFQNRHVLLQIGGLHPSPDFFHLHSPAFLHRYGERYRLKADIVREHDDLNDIPDNSLTGLLISDAMAPYSLQKFIALTKEWQRVLRPGGLLILSTLDVEVLMRMFLDPLMNMEDRMHVLHLIFGEQKDSLTMRQSGFDDTILVHTLLDKGFCRIRRVQSLSALGLPAESEPRFKDYLPSMHLLASVCPHNKPNVTFDDFVLDFDGPPYRGFKM